MGIIEQAIECLAPALPRGSRLLVFSSQARGDARADSDLDLLEVEPQVEDRFAEMARLSTLLARHRTPADVVVMRAEAFERQKTMTNTLAWLAAREGRVHEFRT